MQCWPRTRGVYLMFPALLSQSCTQTAAAAVHDDGEADVVGGEASKIGMHPTFLHCHCPRRLMD